MKRIPTEGGNARVLVTDTSPLSRLVVDDTAIYWLEGDVIRKLIDGAITSVDLVRGFKA